MPEDAFSRISCSRIGGVAATNALRRAEALSCEPPSVHIMPQAVQRRVPIGLDRESTGPTSASRLGQVDGPWIPLVPWTALVSQAMFPSAPVAGQNIAVHTCRGLPRCGSVMRQTAPWLSVACPTCRSIPSTPASVPSCTGLAGTAVHSCPTPKQDTEGGRAVDRACMQHRPAGLELGNVPGQAAVVAGGGRVPNLKNPLHDIAHEKSWLGESSTRTLHVHWEMRND